MTRIAAAATLTLSLALPATAHTSDEIEQWEVDWLTRVQAQGLDITLTSEYLDWVDRHPDHYQDYYLAPPAGSEYDVSSWESLIIIHFPDEAARTWARRVMACESGGDPDAYNSSSGASGLFQFIPSTWAWAKPYPGADPFDAPANVKAAAWLYYSLGPSQWSCK